MIEVNYLVRRIMIMYELRVVLFGWVKKLRSEGWELPTLCESVYESTECRRQQWLTAQSSSENRIQNYILYFVFFMKRRFNNVYSSSVVKFKISLIITAGRLLMRMIMNFISPKGNKVNESLRDSFQ